jgi:CRISPR system Cascade subunit CasD
MNEEKAWLVLYLDAPLQSWGYQSRFDHRTTLSYPTRSGVIGLLCAAMGVDRGDTSGPERLNGLRMTVYALRQSGRLTDYQTVGGGYDVDEDWRTRIPRRAHGKKPGRDKQTVQTYREYLQDSRFGVVLCGAAPLIGEVAAALEAPRWGVWLGRKSCVPASPVCQGVFTDADAALGRLIEVSGCDAVQREVHEADTFEDGNDTLMDKPLDFAERRFAPRRVRVE